MKQRILLVFSRQDAALSALIGTRLTALVTRHNTEVDVEAAYSAREALARLQAADIDLVIVGAHLAKSRDDLASDDGGLEFCKTARSISRVRIALVTPVWTNRLQSSLQRLDPPPALFVNDNTLADEIAAHAAEIKLGSRRLDFSVITKEGTEWDYVLRGIGFPPPPFDRKGPLRVPQHVLTAWAAWALHEPNEDWYKSFELLGRSIIEAFCSENPRFKEDLDDGLGWAGGLHHTRVTFLVERTHYPLALEAIFPPPPDVQDPWMIHAPLFRDVHRANEISSNEPNLFADTGRPLRSLIICADTFGVVDSIVNRKGKALQLHPLPCVLDECRALKATIRRHVGHSPVDEPVVLGEEGSAVTERALMDKLERKWDIVHFAGHTHYSRDGQGYAFLGSRGKPIPVNVNKLLPRMRGGTKLVYFSSCNSGNASFVVDAAKYEVPAVIGYRWRVDDRNAEFHARVFYHFLFKHRTVDTAFWNARRALHRLRPEDNTWASSVLVMGHA